MAQWDDASWQAFLDSGGGYQYEAPPAGYLLPFMDILQQELGRYDMQIMSISPMGLLGVLPK